jgi:hypothetical protein
MIYDTLTDHELIREADGQSGLIKALSERLEMRQAEESVFHDQAAFMRACGHTTTAENPEQVEVYRALLVDAIVAGRRGERGEASDFKAVLDCIYALIGYGLSYGWPMPEGWREVMRSAFAKIDPKTGVVVRGADGNVLPPAGWAPPDLHAVLERSDELF